MKKIVCSIASALVTASSVALIVDYSVRKKKEQNPCPAKLIGGLAGLVAGALISYIPEHLAKKKLPVEQMIDEEEEEIMNENIAEVLGSGAEVAPKKAPARVIELDEETTIEDFIFDA